MLAPGDQVQARFSPEVPDCLPDPSRRAQSEAYIEIRRKRHILPCIPRKPKSRVEKRRHGNAPTSSI